MDGLSLKIKKKLGKQVLITPNFYLFKRNYVEKYKDLQTAGIKKIKASNIENKEISYIGMTKRKRKINGNKSIFAI